MISHPYCWARDPWLQSHLPLCFWASCMLTESRQECLVPQPGPALLQQSGAVWVWSTLAAPQGTAVWDGGRVVEECSSWHFCCVSKETLQCVHVVWTLSAALPHTEHLGSVQTPCRNPASQREQCTLLDDCQGAAERITGSLSCNSVQQCLKALVIQQ